jgi:hypothetical protein
MVIMFTSSAIDCWFEHQPGQTKDHKNSFKILKEQSEADNLRKTGNS